MSRSPLPVRQIKEVLRYRFDCGCSYESISKSLKLSKGSVFNLLDRFAKSGLIWPIPEMSESDLHAKLYPPVKPKIEQKLPSIDHLQQELTRPHVTVQTLWEEYHRDYPTGLKRSAFYERLNRHKPQELTMKLHHKGGEKIMVDYSGDKLFYIDQYTSQKVDCELFLASWAASSYTFADVTETQQTPDCTASHQRAYNWFGCVSEVVIPDNMKTAVTTPDRYNPVLNSVYAKMAEHYGYAVLPARPRKPRDKAVVESNVLHVQRFLFPRLRDLTFYSLHELRAAVVALMEEFNDRPMKDHGGKTRRQRFLEIDLPYAKQLPETPFEISTIAVCKAGSNYHVRFENHHYSVPFKFAGKSIDVFQKGGIVELYHDGVHICRHRLGKRNWGYTTVDEHMPKAHQFVKGFTPEYLLAEAAKIGEHAVTAMKMLLESRSHPEQAFNAGMGIIRQTKQYGNERVNAACRRAIHFRSVTYKTIETILKQGLDKQPFESPKTTQKPVLHSNLRDSII